MESLLPQSLVPVLGRPRGPQCWAKAALSTTLEAASFTIRPNLHSILGGGGCGQKHKHGTRGVIKTETAEAFDAASTVCQALCEAVTKSSKMSEQACFLAVG